MIASRRVRCLFASVSIVALTTTACVPPGGLQFGGGPSPDEACYAEYQQLRNTGGAFSEDFIASALQGAILGGVAGVFGSLIVGGGVNWGAVLATAAAGALTATTNTYLTQRAKQAQTEAQLFQQIAGDVLTANRNIDASQAAFDQLMDCRQREAATIRARLRSGELTRDQAEAEMTALREAVRGDIQLAQRINEDIQERSTVFTETSVAVNADTGALENSANVDPLPATRYAVLTNSNIRSGPGTNFNRVGSLIAGTTVTVTGRDGDWLRVLVNSRSIGFVAARLLAAPGTPEYRSALATPAPTAPEPTITASEVQSAEQLAPVAQSSLAKAEGYENSIQVVEASLDGGGFDLSDDGGPATIERPGPVLVPA